MASLTDELAQMSKLLQVFSCYFYKHKKSLTTSMVYFLLQILLSSAQFAAIGFVLQLILVYVHIHVSIFYEK